MSRKILPPPMAGPRQGNTYRDLKGHEALETLGGIHEKCRPIITIILAKKMAEKIQLPFSFVKSRVIQQISRILENIFMVNTASIEKSPIVDDDIDISGLDFSDIEQKYAVEEVDAFSTIVIVDGLPVVGEDREERLLSVLKKIFAKYAKIKEDGVRMPMVPDTKKEGQKVSKGFLFVDCVSEEDARELVKSMDNYKLDKSHTLYANKFIDFDRIMSTPEEYVEPKKEEYKDKEQLNTWLLDENARDQFFVFNGNEVSVNWNNKNQDPDTVYSHQNWTDTYLQLSPFGTYLATFHKQGIALWGGNSWARLVRFVHPNVKLIEFSPNEEYIVTWSNEPIQGKDENIRIWDVRSGKLLRGFPIPNAKSLDWPFFKWSHDGKYITRPLANSIAAYSLPDLKLVDGKIIKVEGIRDICWSPRENILAYWIPETGNAPARVCLLDMDKRELVRTKNLFMCKLHWQGAGDYLCVKVDRFTKTKKSTYTSLEIFCLREKDVPIEVYDGLKDVTVQSLMWEPEGDRFAIFATEGQKIFFGIYKVEKNTSVKELSLIEKKNVNTIFWNPKGRFLVLAGLRNFQGEMEFWDVDEMQLMASGEHFHATEVEWDPTGRYVISSVSSWRHPTDTGYIIWDFKGQMLLKKNQDRCKQVLWRPRPPTLLSKDQMKNIRRNLKEYSDRFDIADSHSSGAVAEQEQIARRKIAGDWKKWRDSVAKQYAQDREERAALRGSKSNPVYSDVEDDESDEIEEWVEELVEEKTEIVKE